MEQKAKKIAALLKVLANEHRLMILCALIEQPLHVSEIGKRVPVITQSALSQHLTLMKAHGIVASDKHGQHITYAIVDTRVEQLIETLKAHYCHE